MAKCPYCGRALKVTLSPGPERKERPKKDPAEAMDLKQFVSGCFASKREDLHIIAHWAEELVANRNWEPYKTRGQWQTLFVKPNLRAAGALKELWGDEDGKKRIAAAMRKLLEDSRRNGFDFSNLSTLVKYLNRGG